MATWPVVTGNPVPSTNLNELNQRMSNTVEAIGVATVDTSQTTSATTFGDLATVGPSVTVTCPSSKALVFLSGQVRNGNAGEFCLMGFAVSGASTIAASDLNAYGYESSNASDFAQAGTMVVLTNLSTGSNTFTAKYRVSSAASTGTFNRRALMVFPLGG